MSRSPLRLFENSSPWQSVPGYQDVLLFLSQGIDLTIDSYFILVVSGGNISMERLQTLLAG